MSQNRIFHLPNCHEIAAIQITTALFFLTLNLCENIAHISTLKTKEKCAPNYVGIKKGHVESYNDTFLILSCKLSFVGYIKTSCRKASVTRKIALDMSFKLLQVFVMLNFTKFQHFKLKGPCIPHICNFLKMC